jgi:hypothetical protein
MNILAVLSPQIIEHYVEATLLFQMESLDEKNNSALPSILVPDTAGPDYPRPSPSFLTAISTIARSMDP